MKIKTEHYGIKRIHVNLDRLELEYAITDYLRKKDPMLFEGVYPAKVIGHKRAEISFMIDEDIGVQGAGVSVDIPQIIVND